MKHFIILICFLFSVPLLSFSKGGREKTSTHIYTIYAELANDTLAIESPDTYIIIEQTPNRPPFPTVSPLVSSIPNHQSPITNHQSLITNHQSSTTTIYLQKGGRIIQRIRSTSPSTVLHRTPDHVIYYNQNFILLELHRIGGKWFLNPHIRPHSLPPTTVPHGSAVGSPPPRLTKIL